MKILKNKESKYKKVIILASASFLLLLIVCMIVIFNKKTPFIVSMKVRTSGGSIASERCLATSAIENGKDLKTLVYNKNNPNTSSEDEVTVYKSKDINKDYTVDVYYKAK